MDFRGIFNHVQGELSGSKVGEQVNNTKNPSDVDRYETKIEDLRKKWKDITSDISYFQRIKDTERVEDLGREAREIENKIRRLREKIEEVAKKDVGQTLASLQTQFTRAKEDYKRASEESNRDMQEDAQGRMDRLSKKIQALQPKKNEAKVEELNTADMGAVAGELEMIKNRDKNKKVKKIDMLKFTSKIYDEIALDKYKKKYNNLSAEEQDDIRKIFDEGADKYMEQNESKVNEEESMTSGGSTRANDPAHAAPSPVDKPEPEEKQADAPKTNAEPEVKPEEKELPIEGEKEYLGNKGGEEYYYFVIIPAEGGTKDLQIQDANDEVVFSAKENKIDTNSNEDFLWKGIQELQLSNVSTEIVDKYLMPEDRPEDVEKEEGRAETGEEQEQPETEEPKESGVIPELGAPAFKSTVESRKMTTIKELKMRRLICKYDLKEDVVDRWKIGDFIDPIGKISEISPEWVKFQDEQGKLSGILIRAEVANTLLPQTSQKPQGRDARKFYNVDLDKMYKTGDVGEAKMKELLEKYGLVDTKIDILLEKFGLSEAEATNVKAPQNVEDLEKATGDKPVTTDVAPEEVAPEAGMATPGAMEPAPEGGEPKAEEMLSSDSASADLKMKYPEEPYTTTATAYADSIIDDPKIYGSIRNLQWKGVYANAETFLKQAKIVGNYNEFSPDIAKRLVDAVGEGAKFRLAREGSVAVYFTIRDIDKKVSLETLRDLVRADEADATGNAGEARLWWD